MKKKTKLLILLLAIIICLTLPGFYNELKIVKYDIASDKIPQPIRIALLTDLHSCAYGQDQRILLDAIDAQAPHIILLGGDIFDDDLLDDNTVTVLQSIGNRYPCYYVTGNHEYWSGKENFTKKMAALEKSGIRRLSGEVETVKLGEMQINICGVDDPCKWTDTNGHTDHTPDGLSKQVEHVAALSNKDVYTILLTHRPELFDRYNEYDFDLVLAGHAHGGQWRIPGILNGLWAPDQGLFPAYTGGQYEKKGMIMIVSRGLARESTQIPRFYNRPELVIIELHHI